MLAKLVINGDEPVLADDGLGARDGIIEHRIKRTDWNPATIKTGQPAVLFDPRLRPSRKLRKPGVAASKRAFAAPPTCTRV
jgi:hypothetical protein